MRCFERAEAKREVDGPGAVDYVRESGAEGGEGGGVEAKGGLSEIGREGDDFWGSRRWRGERELVLAEGRGDASGGFERSGAADEEVDLVDVGGM